MDGLVVCIINFYPSLCFIQLETERITQKDQMPVRGAYPCPQTHSVDRCGLFMGANEMKVSENIIVLLIVII